MNDINEATGTLTCPACGHESPNTSKERGRFAKRHGAKCVTAARREFNWQLAQGCRSVEEDEVNRGGVSCELN